MTFRWSHMMAFNCRMFREVRYGSRLCENAAVAAQREVGAEAGFCFGVRDRRIVQARIASISDCGPSMATTRFRL